MTISRRLGSTVVAGALAVAGLGVFGGTASAGTDHCVSTNGTVRNQQGSATCSSMAGPGNVAIARGSGSSATAGTVAGDQHDRSLATGDNSTAITGNGSGNTATAGGDNSLASAGNGDDNTATAGGDNSFASAGDGSGNTATAGGDSSVAIAGFGDGNTATADSPGCAVAVTGSGNTDSC